MAHAVLIAAALPAPAVADARARFAARFEPLLAADIDGLIAALEAHQIEALVIGSRTKLTAAVFPRMPASVKIVATTSVGFDHIDIEAAARSGIIITNTPDVLTAATADITLFLMLGALRRGREYLEIIARGWRQRFGFDEMLGMEVGARTLGIVGMGRIGQAVAHRARAFGMPIIYHNRSRLPPEQEAGAKYFPTLEAMLPHAQVLSLNAPSVGSGPLIRAEHIALLPKGAVLVNSGRGALVDEDAMIAALHSGHLAAAGLDVFINEPDYDLRLRDLPNVFMTPHMGSATEETRIAMSLRALDNVGAVLDGRPAQDPVTV
jgi:lactate dehydrogenase-like 2-hydroxyacid dehydrogenase